MQKIAGRNGGEFEKVKVQCIHFEEGGGRWGGNLDIWTTTT